MESYFDTVARHESRVKVVPRNLSFYMNNQLFEDIDFTDKSVLDIGAGIGIYGLYTAFRGAAKVDLLEPEADGSSPKMIATMKAIIEDCNLKNVTHVKTLFQEYKPAEPYDVVLSHNSINHLNEEACIELGHSAEAQAAYGKEIFQPLAECTKPGGLLIIADCERSNLFGDMNLRSPFRKGIEWEKHQDGRTWAELLAPYGFQLESIRYTSYNSLGKLGMILMNNRLMSYLVRSHFVIRLRKAG